MPISILTAEGLAKLLQKIKTVFATKTELNVTVDNLTSPTGEIGKSIVHTSGDETITGTKTFSSTIAGSISGNAATATKLETAKTINGVSFNGTSNITVTDSTKLPLTGGTLTGGLTSKVVNGAVYKIVNTGITKGSDTISGWTYIPFLDSSEAESNQQGRLGYIGFNYNKKANTGCLVTYNGTTATSTSSARLAVGIDASGNVFTEAPTPATADNSTKIATTAFVKAQGYITASGSITGNAATATKIQRNVGNGSYVGAATTGNALVNSTTTTFDAIWNAPTKNYQVACSTWPGNNDNVYLAYSVTKANISSGTNSVAKQCLWNADTGVLSSSGGFSGNVTGNCSGSSGSCTGNAANVTGIVAIANGGTGANTRLKGLQALTNENVGTNAQYFLTITSSWGKGGYSSTANAKTVLGVTGSDRRIKDDIEEIPDEVLDAWDSVKWNQFRMKKEVRQKGDEAPLHFGSVVQDVQKALSNGGIDPDRYGFLYHEDYLPEEMELPSEENPEITNGEKWYLKYAEALSVEAAYLRRRCKRLEESLEDALNRISALEAKGD